MQVLGFAIGLSLLSLLVQIAIWRFSLPRSQIKALLVIFGVVTIVGVASGVAGFPVRLEPVEALHIVISQAAVALAYACLYSAIESPTVAIIRFTAEAGEDGRSRSDYLAIISDDLLLGARFRAMAESGMVEELSPDTYRLTTSGRRMARGFAAISRVVGVSGGG
jgi:hypothetical protein